MFNLNKFSGSAYMTTLTLLSAYECFIANQSADNSTVEGLQTMAYNTVIASISITIVSCTASVINEAVKAYNANFKP